MRDAALAYAVQGWPVFPVAPDAKRPLFPTCRVVDVSHDPTPECGFGHGWKDATTDPDTIRDWWTRTTAANIGIATGPAGLLVIDLDRKGKVDGVANWRRLVADHGAPPARIVVTPSGGLHLVFAKPDRVVPSSSNRFGRGLGLSGKTGSDVRADGGYVVAAPSQIRSGPAAAGHGPLDDTDVKTRWRMLDAVGWERDDDEATEYAVAELGHWCRRVAATAPGDGLHDTLTHATLRSLQLVKGGHLHLDVAIERLEAASQRTGDSGEAERLMREEAFDLVSASSLFDLSHPPRDPSRVVVRPPRAGFTDAEVTAFAADGVLPHSRPTLLRHH